MDNESKVITPELWDWKTARALREDAGLTYAEAEAILGISGGYFSRLERHPDDERARVPSGMLALWGIPILRGVISGVIANPSTVEQL